MKTIFEDGTSFTIEDIAIPGKIWYSFLNATGGTGKPYGTITKQDAKQLAKLLLPYLEA